MFAACCRATATLNCRVVASAETSLSASKWKWVACPSGYVMTGCNAFAESGRSGGAIFLSELSFCLLTLMLTDVNVTYRTKDVTQTQQKPE